MMNERNRDTLDPGGKDVSYQIGGLTSLRRQLLHS